MGHELTSDLVPWQDPGVAAAYAAAAQTTAQTVGYLAVFTALGLAEGRVDALLDIGCGPGSAARAAARAFGVHVCAVDTSPAMLDIAHQQPHPLVDYQLSTDGTVSFLPDASMDACMCCFVFVCIDSRTRLGALTAGLRRVLRSGARIAVLGADPDSVGTAHFEGWTTAPGPYRDGERVRSRLRRPDGRHEEVTDVFWSRATYRQVLTEAGFQRVRATVLSAAGQPPGSGSLFLVTGHCP
ncbi:class I SAM-dependent methyltransferase [Streptomyces natalensis]|uniref:class I SAM-dependent methyltransferase n=1 Tax=Streptomyces natalensis TaxID=68242 RepID=UPI00068C4347|nr:methyltransferase domain-containing protein [Streptomyces natalensis]